MAVGRQMPPLALSDHEVHNSRASPIKVVAPFDRAAGALRDIKAKAFIRARIERFICCIPVDVRPAGAGVSELRIHYGPGYRVCFQQRGSMLVILLAGVTRAPRRKNLTLRRILLVTSRRMNDGDEGRAL
jgi:putative addiction module killer protein